MSVKPEDFTQTLAAHQYEGHTIGEGYTLIGVFVHEMQRCFPIVQVGPQPADAGRQRIAPPIGSPGVACSARQKCDCFVENMFGRKNGRAGAGQTPPLLDRRLMMLVIGDFFGRDEAIW